MTGFFSYFVHQDYSSAKSGFMTSEKMLGEQCVGQCFTRATMRTMGFRAMTYLGDREELAVLVAAALRETEQVGDLYGLMNLRSGPLAWLRLTDDQPAVSERELEAVAEQLPRRRFILQTYFHLLAVVQLGLYRGQGEAAFQRMEASWMPLRRSLLLRMSTVRVVALELRARAALAAAAQATGDERELRLRLVDELALRLPRERATPADGFAALLRAGVQAVRSRNAEACRLAEEAERAFDKASMKLHVAASRRLRGLCVGGAEGTALVDGARQAMIAAGVRRPDRFAAMLAPGPGFASSNETMS